MRRADSAILKECPDCGADGELVTSVSKSFGYAERVYCSNEKCKCRSESFWKRGGAANEWNSIYRPTPALKCPECGKKCKGQEGLRDHARATGHDAFAKPEGDDNDHRD